MNTIALLEKEAIRAAQEQRWNDAANKNQEILAIDPQNISALNRLGFCYLQQQKIAQAKAAYASVLRLDPYNSIACRYMNSTTLPKGGPQNVSDKDFIEEPGKTKTVPLCKLAEQKILDAVPVATVVQIIAKNHCIAIETPDGVYLGTLPDDVSFRLKRLIKSGNIYKAMIRSIGKQKCHVFIKEIKRSKRNQYTVSFPTGQTQVSTLSESVLLDETPMDILDSMNEDESPTEDENEEFTGGRSASL